MVTNDFHLPAPSASSSCPVRTRAARRPSPEPSASCITWPASAARSRAAAARLFLPDRIFTHFEREEDLANLPGKLEDDLLRIHEILLAATPSSVVIMNEIFTSTTLSDARFLGEKVLDQGHRAGPAVRLRDLRRRAGLARAQPVSMVSTIVPDNPAERTFKVVRKPADGLAYALAIADKHRVTYEQLKGRLVT